MAEAVGRQRNDARATRPPVDVSRYRNPDDDPRGPWLATDLTVVGVRPPAVYYFMGHLPPDGRSWRFLPARMEQLDHEGRILAREPGRPRLKRYLADVVAQQPRPSPAHTPAAIIRAALHELARRLAAVPEDLAIIEWRDLERLLGVVFEGLGFETVVTRSGKDGGFDLHLASDGLSYLVEVKHWTEGDRVGEGMITRFAEVVVSQGAARGLLISSSGFTRRALVGRVEVEQHRVALGEAAKVISLCRTYVSRLGGLWRPISKRDVLFEGTF